MSAHPEEDSQRDDLQCDNSSSSSGSESPKHETDYIQLSDSIRLFHHKMIDYRGNVFYGEKLSKVTGSFPLAIKLCPFNENIKKEARVLTKLRPHKHVVSIVHSDVYYQGPIKYMYIAMELCHEQDLHDHVTENKNNNVPFDPQLSISQAKQLVEGLNHIHSNDIIHRGLNPSNVLFSLDKKILKIADFGYSKPMTRGLSKTRVTTVGVGTDGYTAPETLISDEISKQADIFSLGLVFYFLWSNGHHAFGDDPDEWNRNIKKNRHRDLSHLCPILEDKGMITDLLDSMLQVNPKARPTVNQMLSHRIFDGIVQEQEEEMPYAPIDDIPSVEEVRDDGSDIFPVSDTIVIHKRKELYTRRPIFYGEEIREPAEPQPLAVKLITSLDAKHKKEAALMQLLQHANVVSCIQSGVYNNPGEIPYIYIAMELCRQNLHDHVTESKNNNVPFDPQLSISQAKQLVEGLNHIHFNDIIHRDLKPSNVLLSLDKKTLKIGDFGISEQVTRGGSIPNNPKARIGTDGYRAPEIYNSNEISMQADIFSMGLVFYFLWSNGHHAFGDDPDDRNINIKKNKDSDLSQLLFPDCEAAIDILQWMLQFTPQDRPTTLQILNHKIFGEAAPKMETLPKVPISPEARNLGILSEHNKDLTEQMQLEPAQQEEMLSPAVINEATLSQQPHSQQVQITGGEFVGAHFGSTHQHFNLEQHEHYQQVLEVHHHHHYSEQPTSSRQLDATNSRRDQQQAVPLETSTNPRGVSQPVVQSSTDSSIASLNPERAALSVGDNASSVHNIENLNSNSPSAQSVVDPATSLSQPDQPSTCGIHAPTASSVSDNPCSSGESRRRNIASDSMPDPPLPEANNDDIKEENCMADYRDRILEGNKLDAAANDILRSPQEISHAKFGKVQPNDANVKLFAECLRKCKTVEIAAFHVDDIMDVEDESFHYIEEIVDKGNVKKSISMNGDCVNIVVQEITSEGGVIRIRHCVITFPRGAVSKNTTFIIRHIADPKVKVFFEGFREITPTITCTPAMTFNAPIDFSLTAWAKVAHGTCSAHVTCSVFARNKGQLKCIDEKPISNNRIEFSTRRFEMVCGGVNDKIADKYSAIVTYFLCTDDERNFVSVCCVNNDELIEKLKARWRKDGYKIIFVATDTIKAPFDTEIFFQLTCESFKFKGNEAKSVKINKHFWERKSDTVSFILIVPKGEKFPSEVEFIYKAGDKDHPKLIKLPVKIKRDKLSIDEKAALLKHIKALFNDDIIPKHGTLTLDKIDLSGEQLTEEDIDAVAYVISCCTNLHTLDLHDCCLLKTSVRRLEQELQPGVQISFLNIKGNEDFDLDDLLAAVDIKKKCNIEELLYDCNLTRKEKQEFDIYLKRSEIVGENVEGGDLDLENDMKIESPSSKGKAWLKEEIRVGSTQEIKEKERSESHHTEVGKTALENQTNESVTHHEVTGKLSLRETNNKTDIQTKTEDPGSFQENHPEPSFLAEHARVEKSEDQSLRAKEDSAVAEQKKHQQKLKPYRPKDLREFQKMKPIYKLEKNLQMIAEDPLNAQQQLKNIKAVKHGVHQSERARLLILSSSSDGKLKKRFLETQSESSHSLQKSRGDSGYSSFAGKSSARAFRKSKSEAQFSSKHLVDDPYETNPDKAFAENVNYDPNALIKQRHEMTMLGLNIKEGKRERLQKWLQDQNTPLQAFSVGHEGGVIVLKDCKVTFDIGTFDDYATVWVTEEVDSSKWPAGYIGIGPMFYLECDREILKPVKIEMTTWCVSDGSYKGNHIEVEILHKQDGEMEWSTIVTLPLSPDPFIEFKCQDFSPIVAAVKESTVSLSYPINVLVSGVLYATKTHDFQSGFFLHNEKLKKLMEEELHSLGGVKRVKFNTVDANMNDSIHLKLSCDNENFSFSPVNGHTLEITERFLYKLKEIICYSTLSDQSQTQRNCLLNIIAELQKNEDTPNPYNFKHRWTSEDAGSTGFTATRTPSEVSSTSTEQWKSNAVANTSGSSSASVKLQDTAFAIGDNLSTIVFRDGIHYHNTPVTTTKESVSTESLATSQPNSQSPSEVSDTVPASVTENEDKHKHDVTVNITSVSGNVGNVSVSFSEDKAGIMLKGQSKANVKQKGEESHVS